MPNVFETITEAVVHEMDAGGNMIEVRSIVDADRFHCFCLVRGEGGLFGRHYRSTDLTLEDTLETEDGEQQLDAPDSGLPGQYEIFVSPEKQNPFQKVSAVLVSEELQMEGGPADALISSLFNAAGILVEARAEAILDFLDALKELSEEKELVAETLEKGTLPLLKDQLLQSSGVKSVLEQEWGKQPRGVGCDPEAQTVCTLYLVVSVLLQLSEKPAPVTSC